MTQTFKNRKLLRDWHSAEQRMSGRDLDRLNSQYQTPQQDRWADRRDALVFWIAVVIAVGFAVRYGMEFLQEIFK
jgi:hypothetical protein